MFAGSKTHSEGTKTDKLERRVRELSALYEISRTLGSSLDLETCLNHCMEFLAKHLDMKRGTLTLLDPETKELKISVAHGLSAKEKQRGRYKIGEGITGKVLETGSPVIVPDVGREPLFLNRTQARDMTHENISFVCVPVKVRNDAVGVLSVDRLFEDPVALSEDVRALTIIASLIGQAVKLNETVEYEKRKLIQENINLKDQLQEKFQISNIIGESKKMQEIYKIVKAVSKTVSSILLMGESGTGKELIARSIHYNSLRKENPFVKVDCGTLTETLLESELFGHEKGSFTGAYYTKKGKFELADHGTIFLDEISNLGLSSQARLLRVLQDKTFERVGATKSIKVDVRVIAATNKNLEAEIKAGYFREDLFYRLNVVPICLPSLRERREDIPTLVEHFLKRINAQNHTKKSLSPDAFKRLLEYGFPGNVRELENLIERVLVTVTETDMIDASYLPPVITPSLKNNGEFSESDSPSTLVHATQELEKKQILEALTATRWVRVQAAKKLGIPERVLRYKMKKYDIT